MTAADGAPKFYDKNNEVRYENVKQAVEVDKRLRNAYLGHHKFYIVDNNCLDFKAKVDKCISIATKVIGLPTPNSFFKKYLVNIPDPRDHTSVGIPQDIKQETLHIY